MATASALGAERPLVLLIEDEVLVRLTLARMLEEGGFRVLPVANADEALEVLQVSPGISVMVTDAELLSGGMGGLELARKVRDERDVGVVITSGRAKPEEHDLPSGTYFLAKPVYGAALVQLVQAAAGIQSAPTLPAPNAGSTGPIRPEEANPSRRLSPRQHEVLEHLIQGKSNREIAEALNLSEHTVKVHLVSVFRTLGVSSRTEAVLAGLKRREHQ